MQQEEETRRVRPWYREEEEEERGLPKKRKKPTVNHEHPGSGKAGGTALHWVEKPSIILIRALLQRGADPTLKDGNGRSALIHLVWGGSDCSDLYTEGLGCLLEDRRVVEMTNAAIESPRQLDNRGFTALHFACISTSRSTPRPTTLRLLLAAGV